MANMMAVITGLATFFIVLIVAWLINYMVRFILEKRSREFGIYLLIGMKKREISRLYIRENVMLGMGAFLAGMGFGFLLSVFYSMIQMDYHIHLEWNKNCILMTAACFFGCYLLALFRCRRRFKKMNIHDLMESQRRNEEIGEKHEKMKRMLLPFSILALALFGGFLFCYKNWDAGILTAFLIGLVLSIYLYSHLREFGSDYRKADGTPDAVLEEMNPYYAEMAVDIEGNAPKNLQSLLDDIEEDTGKVNFQSHVMTEAAADDWEGEERGNSCSGSDSIVVYVVKNLVRDNLIPEVKYMLSSIIFPLFYVGLVFLCVALTVLSVQQLSDSVKYRFRYRVLSQIGYGRKEINRIILKQLLGYYMCPAVMALLISGLVTVYAGNRFNFYTGVHTSSAAYFLMGAALFFGIYAAYFAVTYIGFKRNVEREQVGRL